MSSVNLFNRRIDFAQWVYSRRHEGGSCIFGSTEGTHIPIVLYKDGSALMGVEAQSYGRQHSVYLQIAFLDDQGQEITYQQWLTIWGPTIAKTLGTIRQPQSQRFDETGRCLGPEDIGLDISVSSSKPFHAAAWYDIFWVPDRSRCHTYYLPLSSCNSGCQRWRMIWSEEEEKAVLQQSDY